MRNVPILTTAKRLAKPRDFVFLYVKSTVLLASCYILYLAAVDDLRDLTEFSGKKYVGLFLTPFVFVCVVSGLKELFAPDIPDEFLENPENESALDIVLAILRRRARKLRVASLILLVLLVFTIVFGTYVFAQAEISARSADAVRSAGAELERAVSSRSELENRLTGAKPEDKSRLEQEIEQKNQLIAYLTKQQIQQTPDLLIVVSAVSTKIGSVLLLLFLTRILVELYRYTVRLAAFYDARADCIQASSLDTTGDLMSFLQFFSSDNLPFGKLPDSPAESVLKIARSVATKAVST